MSTPNAISNQQTAPAVQSQPGRFWLYALVSLVVVGGAAWLCRLWLVQLPVATVSLEGNFQHSDQQHLKAIIAPHIKVGMLALDVVQLRQQLQQQSWIESVSVRKQWPADVHIKVFEQVPVAYWQRSGFLNYRGEVFEPPRVPEAMALPRLFGDELDVEEIFSIYQQLSQLLLPRDLEITTLHKTHLGVYTAQLDNHITIVFEVDKVLSQLHKLVSVYDQYLYDVRHQVARIDLRYRNGLAVAWHTETRNLPQPSQKGTYHES